MIVPLKDIIISTTFTALPEIGVICEFRKSYRTKAQLIVDFHNSKTGCDAEYFGLRIKFARQFKNSCLYLSCQTSAMFFPYIYYNV